MAKIADMSRDLDVTNRFQIHSIPELKDGLAHAANRISRRTRFRGRKLGVGPLANAIFAMFLRLSEEQQERLVEAGVELLETLLESDAPRDDLVSPGASPHQWLVAGGSDPVERDMVGRPGAGGRRKSRVKRED